MPNDYSIAPVHPNIAQFLMMRRQMRNDDQEREIRANQLRQQGMTLNELGRQQAEGEVRRNATNAGYETRSVPQPGMTLNNMTGPAGPAPPMEVPMAPVQAQGFNRERAISAVPQEFGYLKPQMAQEFQAQDMASQKSAAELKQVLATADKATLENIGKHADLMGNMFGAVLSAPPELQPRIYAGLAQQAVSEGLAKPEQIPPFNIEWVKAQAQKAMGVKEQVAAAQAASVANESARHNKATEKQASAMLGETQRHNIASEGQQEAVPELSPQGVDMAAKNFALTGNLPPLGMGKQGAKMRAQVINRAAEMFPAADLATNRAVYGANKDSLAKAQAQLDSVNSFEKTAGKNLDLFLATAKKVSDTGIPFLNTGVRAWDRSVKGSKSQADYDAARQVALTEIAKITNNPGLNGQLSDSARHEVLSLNPDNATDAQIESVAKILRQDMKNRHDSLNDQVKAISERIGSAKAGSGDHHVIQIGDKRYEYKGTGNTADLSNYTEITQ